MKKRHQERKELFAQILPGGFAAGKHAADSGDDKTDEGEAADNVPPVSIVDLGLGDPGVEEGINNAKCAGDSAENDADGKDGQRNDELFLEGKAILGEEFEQVDEEEGGRDGPNEGRGSQHNIVDIVCKVGGLAEWNGEGDGDEDNRGEDASHAGLEDDGVSGNAIFVEATDVHGEAFVDAANEEEACIGIVVDDGGHKEEAHNADGGDVAQEFVQTHIDDGDNGEECAGRRLTLNDQEGEGGDKVADNDDERTPEQVAGDDFATENLAAHIHGYFYAKICLGSSSEDDEVAGVDGPIGGVVEARGGCMPIA